MSEPKMVEKRTVVEGYVVPNNGLDWPEMKVEGAERGGLDFSDMVPTEALASTRPEGTFEIIVRFTPAAPK